MFALEAVTELFFAGVILFCGERAEEYVVDKSGFAGAADTGDNGERVQRNHEVDILEVVHRGAKDAEKFSAGLMADVRNGNAEFAAEVFSGERLLIVEHVSVSAGEEEFAAEFACARAKIDDVAGGFDGVRVVFDDEDGVAKVAQGFENVDQALRVARVQTDRRLVENVKRADEMRAERSGELDALRFAAGESGSEAIEGEVVEADFVEELEATANFFKDFVGDSFMHFGKLQRREKDARFFYGEFADFGDGFVCDANGTGFGAQARATAIGASGVAAITAQEDADVELGFITCEPGEETVEDEAMRGRRCGVGKKFENGFAAGFAVADFDGVDEARAGLGIDGETIDQDLDGLCKIDVEQSFRRRKFVDFAGLHEAVEAAAL